eukprot:365159-Chlamydomonas_euryale.AAC.34
MATQSPLSLVHMDKLVQDACDLLATRTAKDAPEDLAIPPEMFAKVRRHAPAPSPRSLRTQPALARTACRRADRSRRSARVLGVGCVHLTGRFLAAG